MPKLRNTNPASRSISSPATNHAEITFTEGEPTEIDDEDVAEQVAEAYPTVEIVGEGESAAEYEPADPGPDAESERETDGALVDADAEAEPDREADRDDASDDRGTVADPVDHDPVDEQGRDDPDPTVDRE